MDMDRRFLVYGLCFANLVWLGGCSGNGNSSAVTVEGDIPIAYVKRPSTVDINPTDAGNTGTGGDLYIRDKSSPSATEYNITGQITAGLGDVSRPEVSYDGRKIVFAMRCAADTPCSRDDSNADSTLQDTTWSIWEYDFSQAGALNQGVLRRVMPLVEARKGDDFDPTYLPGGQGFVFTSRRQAKTASVARDQPGYATLDEYQRETAAVLHTMKPDGSAIQQISFNQSHDRSPTILQNGRILYARWDHVARRNHYSLFTMKPDGTDMFVLYGAHSDGNSRLHPREMQDGRVITDLMPLSGTHEGGALMVLDVLNYSEQNTPANSRVPKTGGQQQVTQRPLEFDTRNISINGRVTTPYPLWDGSNRVLVAFNPCQVTYNRRIVPCASVPSTELSRLSQERLQQDIDKDPLKNNVPASYSIQMFDMQSQTFRIVVNAAPGMMVKDPVAIMGRPEPDVLTPALAATPPAPATGTIAVRSVYDTDDLGRMGDAVLSATELRENPIPKTSPSEPDDTRRYVAKLAALKNPANAAYRTRPARFVRITKAIATPRGLARQTLGETDFEMQQILGYADVEPDGSFKVDVPADTPIAMAVTDAKARAFQVHTSWLQVRPGEERVCAGCHSPRRGAALNTGPVLSGNHPGTLLPAMPGETMADTRTRLDAAANSGNSARNLKLQIDFTDVWASTDTNRLPCISLRYTGNKTCDGQPDPANDLGTPAPVNGLINYPEHIQPLWNLHCVGCHNAGAVAGGDTGLDLSDSLALSGRLTSYQNVLVGTQRIENGVPVEVVRSGIRLAVLKPARVNNLASQSDMAGLARKSRLMEILSGEELKASAETRRLYPTPALDHAKLLNAAEMRLLAEWIDLGGQYHNNPNLNGESRSINSLSRTVFDAKVHPILMSVCAGCHQANDGSTDSGKAVAGNRFVLTGGSQGDFNVSLSMVNNACKPEDASNYLLSKPSENPHPANLATPQAAAPLPAGSEKYGLIREWIAVGCVQ